MQFSLHLTDLNYCFFQQYLHFERSSNFCSIYLICYTLLLWKPNEPDIFMKLTVIGSYQCDPTWDLVLLGENVYLLVDELYFLVVKTICKYSF